MRQKKGVHLTQALCDVVSLSLSVKHGGPRG